MYMRTLGLISGYVFWTNDDDSYVIYCVFPIVTHGFQL
jgi:hypothetical protein